MTTLLRDASGMTLVEVIIACLIVAIGLVALLGAMPLATGLIGESNLKTTATFLAQHRMEQIKNAQWTGAPLVDQLGGAASNGNDPVAVAGFADRWPDEDYGTIVIATGGTNASYPGFRREVRIADCSVVSCSGVAIGTVAINTLRRVTVTVRFLQMTGTGMGGAEEVVQTMTLIARRM